MVKLDDLESRTSAPATYKEEIFSVLFGLWLVLGLFIDGWAHSNNKPESFFTPWHGVLYSGYLASAGWVAWMINKRRRDSRSIIDAIPRGYLLTVAGAVIFGAGAVGDIVWHTILGVEVGLEALLSPTHLVLLTGAMLLMTGPLRNAPEVDTGLELRAATFKEKFPGLLSLTLLVANLAFFFLYVNPFTGPWMYTPGQREFANRVATGEGVEIIVGSTQVRGVVAILITNLIFMGAAVYALKRWRTPVGSFTFMFGLVTFLLLGLNSFFAAPLVLAALAAGGAADWISVRSKAMSTRNRALLVAGVTPAVLWFSFFAIHHLTLKVGWAPELWAGVTFFAALSGLALALIAFPAVPSRPIGSVRNISRELSS